MEEKENEKQIRQSGIIAGIAWALVLVLSSMINNIVVTPLYNSGIALTKIFFLLLNIVEAIAAMILAVIIYSRFIVKKPAKASKYLLSSVIAGALKAVLSFYIILPAELVIIHYVLSFAVFFVFSIIIDKAIYTENETKDSQVNEQPKKAITANEEMSDRAQFAFNEKLSKLKETAIQIDDTVEAKLFAQAVELQLLKTPATAQFCSLDEMTITKSGEAYIVSGHVDSQNSYGAMIRTPFTLTVFKQDSVWKNANKFVNTSSVIQGKVITNTFLWWIIGIIGSIISFLIYYFVISSSIGF